MGVDCEIRKVPSSYFAAGFAQRLVLALICQWPTVPLDSQSPGRSGSRRKPMKSATAAARMERDFIAGDTYGDDCNATLHGKVKAINIKLILYKG